MGRRSRPTGADDAARWCLFDPGGGDLVDGVRGDDPLVWGAFRPPLAAVALHDAWGQADGRVVLRGLLGQGGVNLNGDDPVGAQTLGEPRRVQILPVGSGGRGYWELSGRRDTERDAVRPVDGNGTRDAGPAARSPGGRDGLEAVGRLRCDGGGDVGRQQQTAGARLCPPGTCGPIMPFDSRRIGDQRDAGGPAERRSRCLGDQVPVGVWPSHDGGAGRPRRPHGSGGHGTRPTPRARLVSWGACFRRGDGSRHFSGERWR